MRYPVPRLLTNTLCFHAILWWNVNHEYKSKLMPNQEICKNFSAFSKKQSYISYHSTTMSKWHIISFLQRQNIQRDYRIINNYCIKYYSGHQLLTIYINSSAAAQLLCPSWFYALLLPQHVSAQMILAKFHCSSHHPDS